MLAVTRTWLPLKVKGCPIAAGEPLEQPVAASLPATLDQDGELVAAEPGDGVRRPGAGSGTARAAAISSRSPSA